MISRAYTPLQQRMYVHRAEYVLLGGGFQKRTLATYIPNDPVCVTRLNVRTDTETRCRSSIQLLLGTVTATTATVSAAIG